MIRLSIYDVLYISLLSIFVYSLLDLFTDCYIFAPFFIGKLFHSYVDPMFDLNM